MNSIRFSGKVLLKFSTRPIGMVEDDEGKLETIKQRTLEVENVDFDG